MVPCCYGIFADHPTAGMNICLPRKGGRETVRKDKSLEIRPNQSFSDLPTKLLCLVLYIFYTCSWNSGARIYRKVCQRIATAVVSDTLLI